MKGRPPLPGRTGLFLLTGAVLSVGSEVVADQARPVIGKTATA